jgi:hypothetical protein
MPEGGAAEHPALPWGTLGKGDGEVVESDPAAAGEGRVEDVADATTEPEG